MEKLYTSKVCRELTERLYKAGMPLRVNVDYDLNKYTNMIERKVDIDPPSYAKLLDWLSEKGVWLIVEKHPSSGKYCPVHMDEIIWFDTFQEAVEEYVNRLLNRWENETEKD